MADTVATNVNGTVITSSPGPIPAASSARCSALVPEFTAIASLAAAVAGELPLERRDLVAEHELPAVEHAADRRLDLGPDALELLAQVDQRNHSATPA